MDTPYLPQSLFAKDFENVYEPAEDTFLLLDAIELDLAKIRSIPQPIVALECGSGSGTVITALSKSLNNANNIMIATDINLDACMTTKKCANYHNQFHIQVVRTDLAESLVNRLEKSVDVLIFNPPYVPTEEIETNRGWIPGSDINLSWAGGSIGRNLTDSFLKCYVQRLLSDPNGVAYLVAMEQNDVKGLTDLLVEEFSIKGTVVIQRRAGQESLYVIKYERTQHGDKR